MPEYMAVRKHHSLLDICRTPEIAAEVTITAAERLGVDAAIIFADLLLPFTPMGLDFEFVNGEGPVVHNPIRTLEQIQALRTDRTDDLLYVSQAIEKVAKHFEKPRPAEGPHSNPVGDQLGIIGFCGAPFTLASYMIEGSGSRNYIEAKKLMYSQDGSWPLLMSKLVEVLVAYAAQQIEAGADVIQVFDSWAGALSVPDYRQYCLAPTTELVRRIQGLGVPVIYFGVDTASLLPTMRETGADVLGLDNVVHEEALPYVLAPIIGMDSQSCDVRFILVNEPEAGITAQTLGFGVECGEVVAYGVIEFVDERLM